MADAIEGETGAEVALIRGGGGIFDVKVDGKLIYSKHDTGHFPTDAEILAALG
ncbi:MAG: Rdx family protein [Pirellulales bacterium]|nr:Rdx family protein [Pirellulales bacterium]